jgi:hypothetical protein
MKSLEQIDEDSKKKENSGKFDEKQDVSLF